jgi:integrase
VSEEIALVRFQQRKLRKLGGATASADIGNRLSTVHSYLTFASFACAARMDPGGEARRVYEAARTAILGVLRARAKAFLPARSTGEPREGLRAEQRQRLLEAITPGHPENPWEPEVQNRNQLVVRLLYELGMRRGEVLCLRVGDVKLTADGALLTVVRRPQDPDDPRQPKPQVKTLGRELLIGVTLRDLFVGYLADRRTLPGARRHPFLFVSGTNGAPLSVWSMTKMFKALRERVPGLSEELSAHVLRHDWNDRFSEMSDRAAPARTEIDATKEERARAYAMGWSNPATATRYTKRWTREAANKRSLDMQERRDIVVERTSSQLGLLEQRGNTKKNA